MPDKRESHRRAYRGACLRIRAFEKASYFGPRNLLTLLARNSAFPTFSKHYFFEHAWT